ncbi:MAG: aminotransferase class III-fold pyridoxal phosphate-dependent enzyme [Pirellulaceae bacterium]|nr:aminotransferase class III-fold pyridoxal phosphate-dependent enzyme [Pirellulaceae bacterium]
MNDKSALQDSSRVARSMELYEQALGLIPGGTQLVSRRPTRFAYGISPVYTTHANGARFTDVDGHEYVDWMSGIGAIILGYADPVVDQAVCDQIRSGSLYSINHPLEIELAERLVELVPCAEMVRYAKGGGEACLVAVRIARGATGRDKVLFCGYHGWHDWYLAANLGGDQLDSHLLPGIEPIGVPSALAGTAIPFPYGDLEALEQRLGEHDGDVAAIIMEPLRSDWPPEGYLAGVQELARRHDVVLIFDEVSTGLRPSAGGIQARLDVVPDMAVFAKSLSNGFAMGAIVGQRAVMEAAHPMFISSTYWSDTVGLRAALTTINEVERRGVPAQLADVGRGLVQSVRDLAAEVGVPMTAGGIEFHPHFSFQEENPLLRQQLTTLFIQEMAKRGCHMGMSFYMNASHGPAEVEQTLGAMRETLVLIHEALESGTVEDQLECELKTDTFARRMVQ